ISPFASAACWPDLTAIGGRKFPIPRYQMSFVDAPKHRDRVNQGIFVDRDKPAGFERALQRGERENPLRIAVAVAVLGPPGADLGARRNARRQAVTDWLRERSYLSHKKPERGTDAEAARPKRRRLHFMDNRRDLARGRTICGIRRPRDLGRVVLLVGRSMGPGGRSTVPGTAAQQGLGGRRNGSNS